MEVEFMTADTALPPCMPLPRAMLRLSVILRGISGRLYGRFSLENRPETRH